MAAVYLKNLADAKQSVKLHFFPLAFFSLRGLMSGAADQSINMQMDVSISING